MGADVGFGQSGPPLLRHRPGGPTTSGDRDRGVAGSGTLFALSTGLTRRSSRVLLTMSCSLLKWMECWDEFYPFAGVAGS